MWFRNELSSLAEVSLYYFYNNNINQNQYNYLRNFKGNRATLHNFIRL